MEAYFVAYIPKCIPCQKHGNLTHDKQEELHHIFSLWPFAKWGMDILGSFTLGKGQVLLVDINYFIKRIEAELLATITT